MNVSQISGRHQFLRLALFLLIFRRDFLTFHVLQKMWDHIVYQRLKEICENQDVFWNVSYMTNTNHKYNRKMKNHCPLEITTQASSQLLNEKTNSRHLRTSQRWTHSISGFCPDGSLSFCNCTELKHVKIWIKFPVRERSEVRLCTVDDYICLFRLFVVAVKKLFIKR